MAARPWYKRYASDFIAATLHMTLEEKGAYSMVLDLIYDRGGPIPDDSRWIARVCGCSTRRWNQLRDRLVELEKITVENGFIDNDRAAFLRLSRDKERVKLVESGAKGGEKTQKKRRESRENNDIAKKGLQSSGKHILEPRVLESRIRKNDSAKADPSRKFAFEGRVVRLSPKDFDRWRRNFCGGDGERLSQLLQQRDDWLASEEATDSHRKRWFIATSNWLAKASQPKIEKPIERTTAADVTSIDAALKVGRG